MIKCPYCGSTAQVTYEGHENVYCASEGHTHYYSCGCGCEFKVEFKAVCVQATTKPREQPNFLFEDEESGELFFVQCDDETKCEAILLKNGFDLDKVFQIGVYDNKDAEALGYDTY